MCYEGGYKLNKYHIYSHFAHYNSLISIRNHSFRAKRRSEMKKRFWLTAVLVTVALLSGAPASIAPEADLLLANLNYSASPHLKIQAMK